MAMAKAKCAALEKWLTMVRITVCPSEGSSPVTLRCETRAAVGSAAGSGDPRGAHVKTLHGRTHHRQQRVVLWR